MATTVPTVKDEELEQLVERLLDYKVGRYQKFDDACGGEMEGFRLNIRGGEWFFKNSGSRKILVEFHGSRSLVF